jgi:quercetin dioxygenase-like cupin family protein
MNTSSFELFEKEALAEGFNEVTQRFWEPDTVLAEHTHPFDASAVVVQGEMWLTCEGSTRHITPGGTFTLPRDTPHAERYGSQGATYWVARRNH